MKGAHPRILRLLVVIAPALVTLLAYLPALGFEYVWDDTIFLVDMPLYRLAEGGFEVLARSFVLSPNYFRPLAVATFVAELRTVGLRPEISHLVNISLHVLNTLLVTLLANILLPGRGAGRCRTWVSPAAGLVYGLHPSLVEGVAFVSSRFDLLLTLFLLLALVADARIRSSWLRAAVVGCAFFAAALSKEMAVAFALVLACWHVAMERISGDGEGPSPRSVWLRKRNLAVYLAILAAGLSYLGLRGLMLGHLLTSEGGTPIPGGNLLSHGLLMVRSMATYLTLLVWPFGTQAPIHYTELPLRVDDPAAWVSLGLLICLGWWLRGRLQAGSGAAWVLMAGGAALLPVVNLLPLELGGGAFVAERFLLFPAALLILGIARLCAEALAEEKKRRVGRIASVGLAIWGLAAVLTFARVLPHWQSNLSLWIWAAREAPESVTPASNLSLEMSDRGDHETALEWAERALEAAPASANAWDQKGVALYYLGRLEEAEIAFRRAAELEPKHALYWSNLAGAVRDQGRLEEAAALLRSRALQLDPQLPSAHLNLGIVHLMAERPDLAEIALLEAARLLPPGRRSEALEHLDRALEPERWLRLGDSLNEGGEFSAALGVYDRAAELGADEPAVAVGRSSTLIRLERWSDAAAALGAALEDAPDDPRLLNNLGVVARELGRIEEARILFTRAADLAPGWELPMRNLQDLP